MPPITIHAITQLLSVFDMPTSVHFYCDILGFTIENRSPTYATENGIELFHWYMLQTPHARLMLNTAYDEGERPATRPPHHDDPFAISLYLSCPDLDAAYEKLRSAHIPSQPPELVHYGFRNLSLHDPDGHALTLQWPVNYEDCRSLNSHSHRCHPDWSTARLFFSIKLRARPLRPAKFSGIGLSACAVERPLFAFIFCPV